MQQRPHLITFDLDDTLWPCAPVISLAERALYQWLQAHAPRIAASHDIASLREHRLALARARPDIAHDFTALRLQHLTELLVEFDHDPALAAVGSTLFRGERNRVTPYADVRPVLTRLQRDYVLVSVTNGNAQVEHTPLADCFHHNLTAADVGAAKPDPAMLHAACELAGVTPRQAWHVGDDPERDVAPARAIGMIAVWLQRDGRPWPKALPAPDLQLADLGGLMQTLETLQRTAGA
jgi:putative hydrolase of the HAD superfamily